VVLSLLLRRDPGFREIERRRSSILPRARSEVFLERRRELREGRSTSAEMLLGTVVTLSPSSSVGVGRSRGGRRDEGSLRGGTIGTRKRKWSGSPI